MKFDYLSSAAKLLAVAVSVAAAAPAIAQSTTPPPGVPEGASASEVDEPAADAVPGETILVTGTRRTDRTVAESPVPVDVYTAADFIQQGSADTNQLLQNVVPSFSVQRFAIADGSSFVRPPNLRGLPPDETLVLVNGKRRHRSALVQLGGGSLSEGSQAVDLAQIPAIAFDSLQVLRDGASAQYGSDAIAGVINIGLRRNDSGLTAYARVGQFYEGDGDDYQVAANVGLKIGDSGFFNVSAEYVNAGKTSRGVTRPTALYLQQTFPNLDVPDPAQRYGNPDLESERVFFNAGIDAGDNSEVYLFGNYGHSFQEESFNYRLSQTVTGPGTDGTIQTFGRTGLFNPIYLTRLPNGYYDSTGATFSFVSLYPGGFTPIFFGEIDDASVTGGWRGTLDFGLTYDFSLAYGQDRLKYTMTNTLNPSLGPDTNTEFYLGSLEQRETNVNMDFSYPLEIGFAKPLTIAFGGEYRRQSYTLGLGDEQSYAVGPYARQVVQRPDGTTFVATQPIGGNGFPGYGPDIASDSSQQSVAIYLDIETDVTEAFSIGGAVRYEHFSDFGGTTNVKAQARYAFSDVIAIRGSASTGFRAPTPGQINTSSVATTFLPGNSEPVELATLPVTNPAAIFFGAEQLSPETAVNLSAGLVLTPAPNATISIDYYNIKVDDRIGTTSAFDVNAGTPAEVAARREQLRLLGVSNYATLGQVQYLTNAFDTRTQGVDVVASYLMRTGSAGTFNTTLGFNYNETEVTARNPDVIDDTRVANIESILPKVRVVASENWSLGAISATVRGNYYSEWTDTASNGVGQKYGGRFIVDLEVGYDITPNIKFTLGAQNILDTYPDRDTRGTTSTNGVYPTTGGLLTGSVYPDSSPFGFNGGFYYARVGVNY